MKRRCLFFVLPLLAVPFAAGCNSTPVTPVVVSLSGIAVSGDVKTAYTAGESFDKTNLVVTAQYSDGSTKKVTDYTISPSGALEVGNTKVTVSYTESGSTKTADIAITVSAPQGEITAIAIEGDMTKKAYTVGEQWDAAGLKVVATYEGGTKADLQSSAYELSFNPTAPALEVTSVSVKAKLVAGSELESEAKVVDGITVSKPAITTITPEEAKALMDKAGEGVVVEPEQYVKGVVAAGATYNETYNQYSGTFEGSDVKFQATDVDSIAGGVDISGYEIIVKGYPELYQGQYKVCYLPAAASPTGSKYNPTLISAEAPASIVSIAVEGDMTNKTYTGGDLWNFEGLSVKATYSDQSEAVLEADKYTFAADPSVPTVGGTSVSVTATLKADTSIVSAAKVIDGITVNAPTKVITKIAIEGDMTKKAYKVGDAWDYSGLTIKATYDIGEPETISSDLVSFTADPTAPATDTTSVSVTAALLADPTIVSSAKEVTGISVVVPVTGITGSSNKTVFVGEDWTCDCVVTPNDATEKGLTYKSNAETIATVSETGVIHGVAKGSAQITVTSVADSTITKTVYITVDEPALELPSSTSDEMARLVAGVDLEDGEQAYIATANSEKRFTTGVQSGNNVPVVEASVESDKLVVGSLSEKYTIVKNADNSYSFKTSDNKYLAATGGTSKNYLKVQDTIDSKAKFNITVEDGYSTIVCVDADTVGNTMAFNSSNNIVSCYKPSTAANYPKLAIYHKAAVSIKTVDSIDGPTELEQNSTPLVENYSANVTYTDETTGKVAVDSIDVDTTVLGATTATAHVGELTKDFDVTIVSPATPEHAGTEADPYTGEDAALVASKLAKGGVTTDSFYIRGEVQSFVETFNPSYGNYSFKIESDFICWRMKNGSEKAKFAEGDIEVGDTVTVYAQIQKFSDGKLETKDGYVTNVSKPAAPTISSIAIDGDMTKKTYEVGDSWDFSGLTITATYSDTTSKTIDSNLVTFAGTPAAPEKDETTVSVVATLKADTSIASPAKEITGLKVTEPVSTSITLAGSGGHATTDSSVVLESLAKVKAGISYNVSKVAYDWTLSGVNDLTDLVGTKAYAGHNGSIKFGSGSADGTLALTIPSTKKITSVVIDCYTKSGSDTYLSCSGSTTAEQTISGDSTVQKTFAFDGTANSFTITGGKHLSSGNIVLWITSIVINYAV